MNFDGCADDPLSQRVKRSIVFVRRHPSIQIPGTGRAAILTSPMVSQSRTPSNPQRLSIERSSPEIASDCAQMSPPPFPSSVSSVLLWQTPPRYHTRETRQVFHLPRGIERGKSSGQLHS